LRTSKHRFLIASRGSKLALYQTRKVKEELEERFPEKTFEISIVKTRGDRIQDVALSKIGDKGLFTKELEVMLLGKSADVAVHSLKDMPTELPDGLMLGGVLARAEVRDALISVHGKKLTELDETDLIATSSLRRKAQLLHFNRRLRIAEIRGNVDTRLQKMNEGYCTAMIMAGAGLQRLGYGNRITEIIHTDIMLPAAGQGAIAIEIRRDDPELLSMIQAINHEPTLVAVTAERIFLRALEGGCQIPVGCYSTITDNTFRITGFVSGLDGEKMIRDTLEGPVYKAGDTALELAGRFLDQGARDIIEQIRRLNPI
jgi:hydroxymethylbilane synthase